MRNDHPLDLRYWHYLTHGPINYWFIYYGIGGIGSKKAPIPLEPLVFADSSEKVLVLALFSKNKIFFSQNIFHIYRFHIINKKRIRNKIP